jgi:probable phosphoglycerate mutase
VLWRHGQTQWNQENRFQGHTDVPLDSIGKDQAARAARLLAGLRPDAIISSDLSRARDTANALAELVGVPITLDEGLRETTGGTWEGRVVAEMLAADPVTYAAWRSGEDVAAGGAETRSQVAERAHAAVQGALSALEPDGLLVVVTHGGTARALIGTMLGLELPQWGALGGLANCSWSVLEEGPRRWRLTEHNAGSLPEPVIGDDR